MLTADRLSRVLCLALGAELVACGESHVRTDIAQASAYPHAQAFTFDGARLYLAAGGRYDRLCRPSAGSLKGFGACVDHHFYVFPVVPVDWTLASPVPAWISCSDRETSFEQCETRVKSYQGEITGRVVARASRAGERDSGWQSAIDDAGAAQGLRTAAGAPVLLLGKR